MSHELEWTKSVVVPLLRRIGFRRVEFTHGVLEAGRDLVFSDYDRFGLVRYYAAQVKDGDLRARSETQDIRTIIEQARQAYETPYQDISTGTQHKISGVYLIINGTITGTAKQLLYPKTGSWFAIIDRDQLGVADMILPRVADNIRTLHWVNLKHEVNRNLAVCGRALDKNNGLLGCEAVDDDAMRTNLLDSLLACHWVERVIDISMGELDTSDHTMLSLYMDRCHAVNYAVMKIPVGPCDESIAESVLGLRRRVEWLVWAGPSVLALCNHVLNTARPEPGQSLSVCGNTSSFWEEGALRG